MHLEHIQHPRYLHELQHDPLVRQLWPVYAASVRGREPYLQDREFIAWIGDTLASGNAHMSDAMLSQWRAASVGDLEVRVQERRDVAERVSTAWGDAIRSLDWLLSCCEELGLVFTNRWKAARGDLPLTMRVLLALHSRGVQVGEEVMALLRAGFAAGAEGRWRTLHELAIVAAFIGKHGDEVAERYMLHNAVGVHRAMKREQAHHVVLGLDPYTSEEMKEARDAVKELCARFGKLYESDFGWAAEALSWKEKERGPTFADIEASLDVQHARAAYLSASEAIHGGIRGLVDNPSQPHGRTPVFLTRGTEFGLYDAGARTAGSLGILARALVEVWSLPADLMWLKCILRIVAETGASFKVCDQEVSRDKTPQHRIVACPGCGKEAKIPTDKGQLRVRCRGCGHIQIFSP